MVPHCVCVAITHPAAAVQHAPVTTHGSGEQPAIGYHVPLHAFCVVTKHTVPGMQHAPSAGHGFGTHVALGTYTADVGHWLCGTTMHAV